MVMVLPLFATPALALGFTEQQGWRIGSDGAARMIPLNGQPAEAALMLRPAPQQIVSNADRRTLLLNAQGVLTLMQPVNGAGASAFSDTPPVHLLACGASLLD